MNTKKKLGIAGLVLGILVIVGICLPISSVSASGEYKLKHPIYVIGSEPFCKHPTFIVGSKPIDKPLVIDNSENNRPQYVQPIPKLNSENNN